MISIDQRERIGMLAPLQFSACISAAQPPAAARAVQAPVHAPLEAPPEHLRTIAETLPPYRVVLHNDDVNDMAHVVRSLLASVPELTTERAVEVMLAAHNHGRAEVIVCYLERAELYRDRLQSHRLTATIERV